LIALAERLLEKEVIFKDDLEKILGKRPYKVLSEAISKEIKKK
jgi:cell division protease FtsH